MLIPEDAQQEMEALIREEFARVNRADSGKPMTLREMENLVSDVGRRLHEGLLRAVIEEQKSRISQEKKTARAAGMSGSARASGPGPS